MTVNLDMMRIIFQSTLLVRGATVFMPLGLDLVRFQSTLLVRGATQHCKCYPYGV